MRLKPKQVHINPSLEKLHLKGKINAREYKALRSGTRLDIIEAFNIDKFKDNDEHVRSILINKAIEDGE